MKIIKMKHVCLIYLGLLSFFQCGAMEDGHYPVVKKDSIIKFEPRDFTDIRSFIQDNDLRGFKYKLTRQTEIDHRTIDFLCTQNKNITIARNEIVVAQRDQIRSFLETLENKESYNEFAKNELKKVNKNLFYVQTIGFAKIFSGLGISIGATYLCSQAYNYFDNPLICLGSFVAGIIFAGNALHDVGQLRQNIMEFRTYKKDCIQKVENAQGMVNFFENIKKLSEHNKKPIEQKGAGQ